MKIKMVVLFFVLTGCSTVEKLTGPNNKEMLIVECGNRISVCYKRASKECPNGYDIIDTGSRTTGFVSAGNGMIGAVNRGSITVQCK